ncbi:unnamed protein product, partial [Candidula unifasciata]
EVPREILARGPEAVEVYEQTCITGTQPVYRTRLMLVGQEHVGKTSLKKALTGQCHNVSEESTDGIDLSASCSFSLNNQSSWKLAVKGDETSRRERLHEPMEMEDFDGLTDASIEEEHRRALAANIANELLVIKRRDRDATTIIRDTHINRNVEVCALYYSEDISTSTRESTNKDILVISETRQELSIHENISDEIVTLVQELVDKKEKEEGMISSTQESYPNETVVLDIWDFAGHSVYYTTHQVFLTSRAVYCIVFNLCDDLTLKETDNKNHSKASKMSTLQYMDFWMRSIHAHAAENASNSVDNMTLSPPIFIVGTHRDSLHTDAAVRSQLVSEKFAVIREFLLGKPYVQNIVLPFYAVENHMQEGEDVQIAILRSDIELIASRQPHMGEQMPIRWLRFEQDILAQANAGVNFAFYSQVYEIAVNHNITTPEEVQALLHFYHDLGMIIYYGNHVTSDFLLSNLVVLNPQWLVNMFKQVTAHVPPKERWNLLADKWNQLVEHGILDDSLLPLLWPNSEKQHAFLLGLMCKFDLICPRLPSSSQMQRNPSKSWYVPMRFGSYKDKKKVYAQTVHDARFYIDFSGFLPEGLFHRVQARTVTWSQEHGGRDLFLARGIARVFVDPDHDLLIEMCEPHHHRIKVLIMHVKDKEATSSRRNSSPLPEIVARVRHFLESCLVDLRSMWMKRLAYQMCFACPCTRVCPLHEVEACPSEECLHFLDLDECLTSQIVCCEHRRIKTEQFKKWFPPVASKDFKEPIIVPASIEQGIGNIEHNIPTLPGWLKGAAKLLSGASDNQDWLSLARLMGYKQSRIDLLSEDLNPCLALLTDWIVSSGNTTMSVDVLLHYLQQLGCHDVIDVINRAKEYELEKPSVFISYQWDVQDEVSAIRDRLERAGFSCWMDIGQMGGGDQLSSKIDQGLRGSKVVIACITPKYTASHLCNRELWLADTLQKPIIPVLMENTGWPPPGGMSVILSQLVFINMKGVGGHGGSGIHADLHDKYTEIIQRVSLYATPDLTPCVDTTTITPVESKQTGLYPLVDRLSGYRTSVSSLREVDFQRRPTQHDSSLDVVFSRLGDASRNAAESLGQNTANSGRTWPPQQRSSRNSVPMAHVRQCSVCSIL